mgnify:FL=1
MVVERLIEQSLHFAVHMHKSVKYFVKFLTVCTVKVDPLFLRVDYIKGKVEYGLIKRTPHSCFDLICYTAVLFSTSMRKICRPRFSNSMFVYLQKNHSGFAFRFGVCQARKTRIH